MYFYVFLSQDLLDWIIFSYVYLNKLLTEYYSSSKYCSFIG